MVSVPYENMKLDSSCSVFSKCCFCIPLRTGCFVLGYISLLLNLAITLFFMRSLLIMAFLTHGFRYVPVKPTQAGYIVHDEETLDRAKMQLAVMIVLLVGCLNVAWLMLNSFLLVGLHKKRPGPIKLHVTVATIRLLLSVLGLVTVNATRTTTICWIEIVLSAYFIMMYYIYAMQLEREQRSISTGPTQHGTADLVYCYPENIDKEYLTEKDPIEIIHA